MKKLLPFLISSAVFVALILFSNSSSSSSAVVEKYSRECDKAAKTFNPEFCLKQRAGQLATELLKERAQMRILKKQLAAAKVELAKKNEENKKLAAELVRTKTNARIERDAIVKQNDELRKDLKEGHRINEYQSWASTILAIVLIAVIIFFFLFWMDRRPQKETPIVKAGLSPGGSKQEKGNSQKPPIFEDPTGGL